MKYFKIINLALLFIFFYSLVNAKPLPPGTGNAVPSNILFLVDRSQSMNTSASGGVANQLRRPPIEVVGVGDGNYYLATKSDGGIYTFDADQDKKLNSNDHFKGAQGAYGHPNSAMGRMVQMEYHEGTKKLYVLADQRIESEDYRNHRTGGEAAIFKNGGFIVYAVDPKKKAPGSKDIKNSYWNDNGSRYGTAFLSKHAKNYSTTFKTGSGFFQINPTRTSKKHIHDSYGRPALSILGLTTMSLNENKLYIITSSQGRGTFYNFDDIGNMIVVNIDNNTFPHWKGIYHCEVGRIWGSDDKKIYSYFNEAIDVVTEGSKTVIYGKKGTSIYRVELDNNGCIPNLDNFTPIVQNDPCGKGNGSSIVVKNKKIYTTGYYTHSVCRHDVLTTTGSGTSKFVKKIGIRDATRLNTADLGDIYLLNPMGIDFGKGSTNHEKTLFVVSEGRSEVTMIDENDLSYKDHFGDPGVSRFTGVKEAIRYILNDSATTQQADFGIALWFGDNNNFNGFKKDGNGDPIFTEYASGPCKKDACLEVGINPRGAQQILSLFDNETITLHYKTKTKGFRKLLNEYFKKQTYPSNPIDPTKKDCQTTAIILIGDGNFKDVRGGNGKIHNDTVNLFQSLFNDEKILTYAVGYGEGIDGGGEADFTRVATAGGTLDLNNGKAFFPKTPADLKKVTDTIVQHIISQQVVFSAPSISSEVKKSGELFQAKFENRNNKEWFGTVIKTTLEVEDGDAKTETWHAHEQMPSPDDRKLWTALPGDTSINNFTKTNVSKISDLFDLQDNQIGEYWRATTGQFGSNTTRCGGAGKDGVIDDEDKGLIEFVRGKDFFDYNGDCNLNEERKGINKETGLLEKRYLGDIYNSNLLILGSPKGSYSDYNKLSEAYFRSKKNYATFASNNSSRLEVVYGAANNGVFHAFSSSKQGNYKGGEEIWGFVPPLIIPKIPTINNASLNDAAGGGTIPKFLLDGSAVAHDTYFDHPAENKGLGWYTIMMVPYGRAGAGFSVIDVTDVEKPNHLYSILNDASSQKIFRVDHKGTTYEYVYRTNIITGNQFNEILKAEENAADTSKPNTCNDTGNTSCYKGNTLTVIGQVLDKSLLEITINGEYVTATSNITDDGSSTFITLPKSITHNASDTEDGVVDNVSIVEVGQISQAGIDYDYRFLGETWGSPRVFRMPNNGAGDRDIMDDEYVAVLPGGFGNGMPSIGSNVYIIDWITGKVKKEIKIKDSQDNDIVNSIPSSPVVITSEAAQEVFSGALVYINDLEGKITKINLTNMQGSYAYNQTSGAVTQTPPTGTANSGTLTQDIKLYDNYTFFDLEASTQTNNRYMYHSMEAGKGAKSKKFWLFGGTGDYMNLNDKQVNGARVKNVIFGVKDHLFPGFGSLNSTPDKLVQCVDMTDETNAQCADSGDRGWYKILKDRKKVTAEPTLANNIVYYPIYKPDSTTLGCGEGDALICAVDADCGYNRSSELDENGATDKKDCYKVGQGVLSKLVIFGKKLYANISGKTDKNKAKRDIVIINAIDSDNDNLRSSWRENF